jgi:hypothetical protein
MRVPAHCRTAADSPAASPLNLSLTPPPAGRAAGAGRHRLRAAGCGGTRRMRKRRRWRGGGAVLLAASGRSRPDQAFKFMPSAETVDERSTSCGLHGGGAGGSVRIVAWSSWELNHQRHGRNSRGRNTGGGGRVRIEVALNTFTGGIPERRAGPSSRSRPLQCSNQPSHSYR